MNQAIENSLLIQIALPLMADMINKGVNELDAFEFAVTTAMGKIEDSYSRIMTKRALSKDFRTEIFEHFVGSNPNMFTAA